MFRFRFSPKAILNLAIGISFSFLLSCGESRVYQNYKDFDKGIWEKDSVATFDFKITDPNQPYDISYLLRNSGAYQFYNIYIKYALVGDDGEILKGDMHETYLMDPKTGRPFGTSVGDLYTHEVLLLPSFQFPKEGAYSLQIQQYMRPDSLRNIFSVGTSIQLGSQEN